MEKRFKNWQFALGLNEIDEVTPSYFMQSLIEANIIGMVTDSQAEKLLYEYLKENKLEETYETDLITLRIKRVLSTNTFKLTESYLCALHKYIFNGIFPHAGEIRTVDLSKREKCLDNGSVIYAEAAEVPENLAYDFYYERQKTDKRKNDLQLFSLVKFISNLWQAHPFKDGNTRTIAVFTQKYLTYLGYQINEDVFANNATYFRNALVRSNPTSVDDISPDYDFLLKFFDKLLYHPEIELDEKETYISHSRV